MIFITVRNGVGKTIELTINHLLRDMPCPWCMLNATEYSHEADIAPDSIRLNTFEVIEIGVRCDVCRAEIIDISTNSECNHCDS